MPIRKIAVEGDECLTKVCRPVTEFNDRLFQLLEDMNDTLKEAKGAGLAAPQVGVLRRVALVLDEENDTFLEFINPRILHAEGIQDGAEGCLSVPGRYGMVDRPKKVTVLYQDRTGKEKKITLEDFSARCACHEIDHLDGKLYTRLVKEYLKPEDME
ncbi:peptide deformylase [Acidaminobacterium chupaoyuni]